MKANFVLSFIVKNIVLWFANSSMLNRLNLNVIRNNFIQDTYPQIRWNVTMVPKYWILSKFLIVWQNVTYFIFCRRKLLQINQLFFLSFWCELSYKILVVLFLLCNSWFLKLERTLFYFIKRLLALVVAGSNVLDFSLVTANFSVNLKFMNHGI